LGVCSSSSGDGGPATQAVFDGVGSLVIGPDKKLYISDGLNHEIRSVDTQGIIHWYAGTGSNICNIEGSGSQATSVAICAATGLAVDSMGNLYFSDALTESIRKITPGGILSTIGGVLGASPGYSGDGGPALSAHLNNPWNLVVDSKGNIYFVDNGNDIIRRIDATTTRLPPLPVFPSNRATRAMEAWPKRPR
jgi:DNA-binding beta-propeller fold protein YncE